MVNKFNLNVLIFVLHSMFFAFFTLSACSQELVVKTNALYWATGTPNVAAEFKISNKISIDIPMGYNAWKSSPEKRSLRHYTFQPEARYWWCRTFEGHFVGAHAHYAKYNMGNIPFLPATKEYMYKGNLWGGGVSYGFHWVTGTRWGVEATIGVGYAYMNYKKYIEGDCCAEVVAKVKRHYFGPTRFAINLVYFIR